MSQGREGAQPGSEKKGAAIYSAPSMLDLAEIGIRRQGVLRLRIDGESMMPLLHHGDTVEAGPVEPQFLCPGSLVVARVGETLVTHRLIRKTLRGWLVKGDNRRLPDDFVDEAAMLGLVWTLSLQGRDRPVDLKRFPWPLLNPLLALLGELEMRLCGTAFTKAGQRGRPARLRRRWAALPPRLVFRGLIAVGLVVQR